MNALIVVDIQNDFIPGGRLAVSKGDEIIPLVNSLQQNFNLVVATQDWHPTDHKSFSSNHPGTQPFHTIDLHRLKQVLWPDHCIQGTEGAEFPRELNTDKVEAIFRKGMDREIDSYSGFFDNGYRKATGLAGYLRDRQVQKVFVCGLAADYCVAFTALDSIKENFKTYFIEDATRAIAEDGFANMKERILTSGGHLIHSDSLNSHL